MPRVGRFSRSYYSALIGDLARLRAGVRRMAVRCRGNTMGQILCGSAAGDGRLESALGSCRNQGQLLH